MVTIELQVTDESLVKKVKQACEMIIGVTSVKVKKETKNIVFDPETGKHLNDKSVKVIEDAMMGKGVTQYDSLSDFYKEMGL